MTQGLLLILALLTTPLDEPVSTAPPQPTAEQQANASGGEPLPPGVPTDPYELTAWCYGALGEYLTVYDQVIPDLREIDTTYGASVRNEAQPYADDVAAARQALVRFASALRSAERASAQPIAPRGAAAIAQGRGIWSVAERGTRRQLARAWLYWGVPDQCDITARALRQSSVSAAQALAARDPAAAAAARAQPGAVALAPLTAPLPATAITTASVLPPTFTRPAPAAVATAPTPPRAPSRIVEDPPVALAAAAPPPAPPPPVSIPRASPPPGSPPPAVAVTAPRPPPAPVAMVQAPPAPAPVAPLIPAPPTPAPPPILATASVGPDEPMEPRL